ncbi:MotA/TolQ/ExbB proton channel family protein [Acidisoma silvae]|uniref:MotA/TolQ/ExbB proton channel family protein n=1 Tax=Acidisoma silvae TaxID=2802396 RepID=A0A964DYE3_9PROT|nr:MotA/TolQ/ExbB proton channel family protein [Acidisoma silvae]MCB8874919.1 MotA/TolQ/ExbB proton channel family protein [Acidisoma silvae]
MTVLLGLLISVGLILGSVIMDGDNPAELIGVSAAMIVIGGTFGAVVTQFGVSRALVAVKAVLALLKPAKTDIQAFIGAIADWSNLARSQGSLALETVLGKTPDPLQQKGLQMIIDNTTQEDLRSIFKILSDNDFRKDMMASEFFEAAGGYAPTIGVLGAVLGLIHVMTRLDHPDQLGSGIATAFVATVYGVGFANMVFLPLGARLAAFAESRRRERQIVIQGFMLLAEGKSGTLIRQNLQSFVPEPAPKAGRKGSADDSTLGAAAGQAA